jgi:hypothetical protein
MALITEDHLEQQCLDQVILFQAADGQVTLDVSLEAYTVWLSQGQIAELTRHMATAQGLGLRPAHNPRKARMTKY